jgi:hypothetical protein
VVRFRRSIAAAYQLTQDLDAAHRLTLQALRPACGPRVNDHQGHAAVLARFDEVKATG